MLRRLAVVAVIALACAKPGQWFKPGGTDPSERSRAIGQCRVKSNAVVASCTGGLIWCSRMEASTFEACMQGEGWYWDPRPPAAGSKQP